MSNWETLELETPFGKVSVSRWITREKVCFVRFHGILNGEQTKQLVEALEREYKKILPGANLRTSLLYSDCLTVIIRDRIRDFVWPDERRAMKNSLTFSKECVTL